MLDEMVLRGMETERVVFMSCSPVGRAELLGTLTFCSPHARSGAVQFWELTVVRGAQRMDEGAPRVTLPRGSCSRIAPRPQKSARMSQIQLAPKLLSAGRR